MYYNDVDLTLQIRLFTNIFRLVFVVSQCFAWFFIVDLEHDDLFEMTSCCQYVLSRILLRLDVSCFSHNLFRRHLLCQLNLLLFDHFNCYLQLSSWRECWRLSHVCIKYDHRDISSRDRRSSVALLSMCFLFFNNFLQTCYHLFQLFNRRCRLERRWDVVCSRDARRFDQLIKNAHYLLCSELIESRYLYYFRT